MEIIVGLCVVGIIILFFYINSLKSEADQKKIFEKQSRENFHEKLALRRNIDLIEATHKKTLDIIIADSDKKIKKLDEELTIHRHALAHRMQAEPWLASYILQLKTAQDEYNIEKRLHYRTIESLAKRFREKYKPAVAENITIKARMAEYELLFPSLPEYVEIIASSEENVQEDGGRSWLTDEEFQQLNIPNRNQLILDRYHSRNKTNWQIGRDYEMYIGHIMKEKGYTNIIQHGIIEKLEDLGVDIIATNPKTGKVAYIQCKNWSQRKEIRENTITQLYAGALIYMLNHNENPAFAEHIIYTSTTASPLAKKCAHILGIEIHENISLGKYPSIKCHSGENGKIYHLPIDQMYDRTFQVDEYAHTIEEAEQKGYRRAFRWHGQ
jgi:hypothetical protein